MLFSLSIFLHKGTTDIISSDHPFINRHPNEVYLWLHPLKNNKIVLSNKNILLLGGPAVSSAGSNLILGLNPLIASLEVIKFPFIYCLKNRALDWYRNCRRIF